MCNFNDKETAILEKWGNENAYKEWMASYNKKSYPEPDRKDTMKMKEFFKIKYQEKRFCKKEQSDSDDDSSSDEDDKKKKKKEKEKKKKKDDLKKKVEEEKQRQ